MATAGATRLDTVLAQWHWRTRATAWADADAAELLVAFEQVTLAELPATAKRPGRPASGDRRGVTMVADLLDQGFVLLDAEPHRELVLGQIGQFWRGGSTTAVPLDGQASFVAFAEPGYAKAAFSLRAQPLDRGAMISVETRLAATDVRTHRQFNRFWLAGSWTSPAGHQQLLDTVRRRATVVVGAS